MSPVLHPLQGTVFIWALVWVFCFFLPALFSLSQFCGSKTFLPVTSIWSPISFYSINIFSALVPGESCAGSEINGSSIMGPHYPACLGYESMESCCGFCCFWVFAVDSLTQEIQTLCTDCSAQLAVTSCFTGVTGSLKLNNHSWGKIYWITNNPFFSPHSFYLLAVIMPKGISCLMKLTEMLCEKATTGAERHLLTGHSLPVHC